MITTKNGNWQLSLPPYDGGVYSDGVYDIGYGKDITPGTSAGKMQLIAKTTADEFKAYVAKLVTAGYEKIFENEINGNLYAELRMGAGVVYTYFVSKFSEARVIEDRVSCPIDRFGFAEEGERDSTAIYQYAMMYAPPEENGQSQIFGRCFSLI